MKTVLITGIGRGIGRALAHVFLDKGFFVIGTSTKGTVDFEHEHLSVCQLDLSLSPSIDECVKTISGLGKKIDILINNAGVMLDEDDTVLVPDKLRATLEVNLVGTADFTEHMLEDMTAEGHIIFLASTAGSLGYSEQLKDHFPLHYPAYKISKAALNMYMRTLATRLKSGDLIVSSVHPGWVRTEMGGAEATTSPEDAAAAIYAFALTSPETGFFWYEGKRLPW